MSREEATRWNAKYIAFYVTRYSPISGKFIQVGKDHQTIEDALESATIADTRNSKWMHFIDVVKP